MGALPRFLDAVLERGIVIDAELHASTPAPGWFVRCGTSDYASMDLPSRALSVAGLSGEKAETQIQRQLNRDTALGVPIAALGCTVLFAVLALSQN